MVSDNLYGLSSKKLSWLSKSPRTVKFFSTNLSWMVFVSSRRWLQWLSKMSWMSLHGLYQITQHGSHIQGPRPRCSCLLKNRCQSWTIKNALVLGWFLKGTIPTPLIGIFVAAHTCGKIDLLKLTLWNNPIGEQWKVWSSWEPSLSVVCVGVPKMMAR